MHGFKMKCAILIGSLAICMAGGLKAETWSCDLKVGKRQQLVPSQITFKFDEYVQDILVTDSIGLKYGVKNSRGAVSVENAKRRSILWTTNGLAIQRTPDRAFPYYGIEFRAVVVKKTRKLTLTAFALPRKFYQPYNEIAMGRCKVND
jgi:hypothetical protein